MTKKHIHARHETLKEAYGPLQGGRSYEVLKEGYDYLLLKYKGKNIYVPKVFIFD